MKDPRPTQLYFQLHNRLATCKTFHTNKYRHPGSGFRVQGEVSLEKYAKTGYLWLNIWPGEGTGSSGKNPKYPNRNQVSYYQISVHLGALASSDTIASFKATNEIPVTMHLLLYVSSAFPNLTHKKRPHHV